MNQTQEKTMRDVLIDKIYRRMGENDKIFFLSADFGAPSLDKIRKDFSDRFINVGIAEQNLINVATGLALEGFAVYTYAIAGFLTMRAYEQIRINLSLLSQNRQLNVNLIGVGTGVSYDMAGPSHHCLEDVSIIRTLPNIVLCSPADWFAAGEFVDFSLAVKKPKYIRLDGKPLSSIYNRNFRIDWRKGFCELIKQNCQTCIISTGCATQKATRIIRRLQANRVKVGLIDLFVLKPLNEATLFNALKKYKTVITIEEAFGGKGGLDALIATLLRSKKSDISLKSFGFEDKYMFKSGNREFLAELNNFGENDIVRSIIERST